MAAFIASFLFVVLAEMGDKSQLLSMAFATRFKAYQVLIGVFLATFLNHAIAVAVGHYLTVFIPLEIISFIASLSFIFFGLWILQSDRLKGGEQKINRFGVIATIAIAFFFAEMGDKTQLATISLAIQYNNLFSVLMGTTIAMVAADSIAIGIGIILKKRIPFHIIRWISALIFVIFGFIGVYDVISPILNNVATYALLAFLSLLTLGIAFRLARNKNV